MHDRERERLKAALQLLAFLRDRFSPDGCQRYMRNKAAFAEKWQAIYPTPESLWDAVDRVLAGDLVVAREGVRPCL